MPLHIAQAQQQLLDAQKRQEESFARLQNIDSITEQDRRDREVEGAQRIEVAKKKAEDAERKANIALENLNKARGQTTVSKEKMQRLTVLARAASEVGQSTTYSEEEKSLLIRLLKKEMSNISGLTI